MIVICDGWRSQRIAVSGIIFARHVIWEFSEEIEGIKMLWKATREQFTLIDSKKFWMLHHIHERALSRSILLSVVLLELDSNIIFRCRLAFVWPSDVSMVPCLNCNSSCHLVICLMSRLTLLTYFSINFSRVCARFIWMLKVLWGPTHTVQFYRLSCGNGCFLWPAGNQLMYLFESQWRNAYIICTV